MAAAAPAESPARIFARFLRFGLLAWGGPVAQIALIKRELVEEARWIEPSRFNRVLAIYQLLPGPEAHELCVHFGMIRGRRMGGLMAGLGFLLPGLCLVLLLAWAYQRLDLTNPALAAVFLGIQVGVLALIVRAVHRIAAHALGDRALWAVAVGAATATVLGARFWIVLPAAGLAYHAAARGRGTLALAIGVVAAGLAWWLGAAATGAAVAGPETAVGTWALFLSGLKAGLLTFGGAYTAIPFVRGDAVGRGWVSEGQFLDAVALSGIIPAPLIIFATFVGYLAGGLAGALAMTAGIFLPAFAFGIVFFDRLEALVEDTRLHDFIEGVTAAVVALIAVTAVQVGLHVAGTVPSLPMAGAIFAAALAILYLWPSKLNVIAVVAGASVAGLLLFR